MNTIQIPVTEQTIAAFDAGRQFDKVLKRVKAGEKFVVEEGKPVAAVIPFQLYKQWKQQVHESFFDTVKAMQTSTNLNEEEAMKLANEAVTAVRKEAKASKNQ